MKQMITLLIGMFAVQMAAAEFAIDTDHLNVEMNESTLTIDDSIGEVQKELSSGNWYVPKYYYPYFEQGDYLNLNRWREDGFVIKNRDNDPYNNPGLIHVQAAKKALEEIGKMPPKELTAKYEELQVRYFRLRNVDTANFTADVCASVFWKHTGGVFGAKTINYCGTANIIGTFEQVGITFSNWRANDGLDQMGETDESPTENDVQALGQLIGNLITGFGNAAVSSTPEVAQELLPIVQGSIQAVYQEQNNIESLVKYLSTGEKTHADGSACCTVQ